MMNVRIELEKIARELESAPAEANELTKTEDHEAGEPYSYAMESGLYEARIEWAARKLRELVDRLPPAWNDGYIGTCPNCAHELKS